MELRQVEHFLAVVRTGSFTAGALEVHVVQSALSASIRKLESDLGAQLFERTTRRVVLTEAGQALLPMAHRLVAVVAAARDEVAAVTGLARGRVSVGAIKALSVVDLPGKLGEFHARNPGISIHVREGTAPDLAAAVGACELDLAYLAGEEALPEELFSFARWSQTLVFLCYPGHRLQRRRRIRLAELDDEPFVDFTGSGLQSMLARRFSAAGLRHNRVGEATQMPLVVDLVAAGLGVTIIPEPIAQQSGLPFARIEEPSLRRAIHLAGRTAKLSNPAAEALLTHLLS